MRRARLCQFLFLPVMLLLVSCNTREDSAPKSQESGTSLQHGPPSKPIAQKASKPAPPLNLAVPAELPGKLNDVDIENMDADDLLMIAQAAAKRKDYNAAAIAQYWFHRKTNRGQYDLSCYLALLGQIDPAFYWLQQAAIDEGMKTQHVKGDQDLVLLRADSRWNQVLRYYDECNRYFETADIGRIVLILPTGYAKPTAIPAVVWMHGLGSQPDDFVNEGIQEYADRLNVALIGVSGSKPRGPNSFVWAEDIEQDAKRIRGALAEVSDRVTIEKGKVITFGFSQGAQVGMEIAAQYPDEFAGSIVLSPGGTSHLYSVKPSPLLAKRGFVVCCGEREMLGNVLLAGAANNWLSRAKAQVKYKLYPGVSAHSFPEDFNERFPEWVKFILSVQ